MKNTNKETPKTNEELRGKLIDTVNDSKNPMLNKEIEIDKDGIENVVDRARNVDGSVAAIPEEERSWNENESLSRGVSTEEEAMKTVENKDLNSDITAKRYPNSNPDNHIDRGNMKLDN